MHSGADRESSCGEGALRTVFLRIVAELSLTGSAKPLS